VGVASGVLELDDRLFELGLLGFFLGQLVVPGEVLLPYEAEEQEVLAERQQDQDQDAQDQDAPVVAVH
jgi:hypothetical protein